MEESTLIQSIRAKVSKDVLGFHSYRGDDTILVRRESVFACAETVERRIWIRHARRSKRCRLSWSGAAI